MPFCRRTMATLRPWRFCCRGRGRWTRGTRRGGRPWPWLPFAATLTVFTPSSARGRRRAAPTRNTGAPLYTWQVGSSSISWCLNDFDHVCCVFVSVSLSLLLDICKSTYRLGVFFMVWVRPLSLGTDTICAQSQAQLFPVWCGTTWITGPEVRMRTNPSSQSINNHIGTIFGCPHIFAHWIPSYPPTWT